MSRYSTVIKCDVPDCPSRFATGSLRSLARGQARDLEWLRVPPWTLAVEDSPRRRLDACPAHAVAAQEAIRSREVQRALARADKILHREERLKKAREKQEAKESKAAAAVDASAPVVEVPAEDVVRHPRRTSGVPSNLDVVEQILRERGTPMTVGEIVEAAIGAHALPTHSRTPRTVVARDLAIDVRDHADSRFARVAPGTFALRSWSATHDSPPAHEPELGAHP